MSKRSKRKQKAAWYSLRPLTLVLTILYLGLLIAWPWIVGEGGVDPQLGFFFLVSVAAALLLGWIAWRVCAKSDRIGNVVFCLVIAAFAVWNGLDEHQRADAGARVREFVNDPDAMLSNAIGTLDRITHRMTE
ncbi:MAG: hypothetical protein ACYTGC_12835 [Planctomycetota bacterium]|jgi:hypothetical protein